MKFRNNEIAVLATALDAKSRGSTSIGIKEMYGSYEGIYNYSIDDDHYSIARELRVFKEFASGFSEVYFLFANNNQLALFYSHTLKINRALFGGEASPLINEMFSIEKTMNWLYANNLSYLFDGMKNQFDVETQYEYFTQKNLDRINVYSEARATEEIADNIYSLILGEESFVVKETPNLFDYIHVARMQNSYGPKP